MTTRRIIPIVTPPSSEELEPDLSHIVYVNMQNGLILSLRFHDQPNILDIRLRLERQGFEEPQLLWNGCPIIPFDVNLTNETLHLILSLRGG